MPYETSSIGVNNAVRIFESITTKAKIENDKIRSFELYQFTCTPIPKTFLQSSKTVSRRDSLQMDDETVCTVDETVTDMSDSFSLSSSLHSTKTYNYKWGRRDSDLLEPIGSHNSFSFVLDEIFDENFSNDISDWNILRILGEGAFGKVAQVQLKAPPIQDNDPDKCYALKVISKYQVLCDGSFDEIVTEKKMMKAASAHPFIVKLRTAWQDMHSVYFLQDFVQGGELYSLMLNKHEERCALPENHVKFYIACLADALYYLHRVCNIVYRDLKPENVLIDSEGYPVVVDLGLAKMLSEDDQYETRTFCGTPWYVAPEQINGDKYSFGVDNWALGVLTYEMVTGIHPFDDWEGRDEMSLFNSIVSDNYRSIPQECTSLSPEARDFMDRLLEKDPKYRLGNRNENFNDNFISSLQEHVWLSELDIDELRERNIPAPWIPDLKNSQDAGMFNDSMPSIFSSDELLKEKFVTPLTAKEQEKFAAFDYA